MASAALAGRDVPSTSRETQECKSGRFPNYDSNDYKIVSTSELFIDKTPLIKKVLESGPYLLIATPEGFGKSTNLDMISRFVEMNIDKETGRIGLEQDSPNYVLFEKDRLISADKEFIKDNFAKYAVIKISFKNIYSRCIHSFKEQYSIELSKLFADHEYLLKSDKIKTRDREIISKYINPISITRLSDSELEGGIAFLAKMLSKHCPDHKVFTFIDDYDSPLLMLMGDHRFLDESENECTIFFRNIFAKILRPTGRIHRALFTGLSTIGTIFSPPDCPVEAHEFLTENPFLEYYGTTPNEMDEIIKKFNLEKNLKPKFIGSYGYVSLDTKIIICTAELIYYLASNEFTYKNIIIRSIARAVTFDMIRYFFEKLIQTEWLSYIVHPYTEDCINDIRRICIGDYSDNYLPIKYRNYMHLIRELGFVKIKKGAGENVLLLKAGNDYFLGAMAGSLIRYYTFEYDKFINEVAEDFDFIPVATGYEYFMSLNVKLQKLYKDFFKDKEMNEWNNIYSPFVSLLGKSFYSLLPAHFASDTTVVGADGLHAAREKFGFNLAITYMSSPRDALEEILQKSNASNWPQRFGYSFVGINFDKEFSPTFGTIINSRDINKAIYHTFEQSFPNC